MSAAMAEILYEEAMEARRVLHSKLRLPTSDLETEEKVAIMKQKCQDVYDKSELVIEEFRKSVPISQQIEKDQSIIKDSSRKKNEMNRLMNNLKVWEEPSSG